MKVTLEDMQRYAPFQDQVDAFEEKWGEEVELTEATLRAGWEVGIDWVHLGELAFGKPFREAMTAEMKRWRAARESIAASGLPAEEHNLQMDAEDSKTDAASLALFLSYAKLRGW